MKRIPVSAIVTMLLLCMVPSVGLAEEPKKTPEDECDDRCGKGKVWDWHPCQCIDSDGETCKPEDMGCFQRLKCDRVGPELLRAMKLRASLDGYANRMKRTLSTAGASGPQELRSQASAQKSSPAEAARLRSLADMLEREGIVSDDPRTGVNEKAASIRTLSDRLSRASKRLEETEITIRLLSNRRTACGTAPSGGLGAPTRGSSPKN